MGGKVSQMADIPKLAEQFGVMAWPIKWLEDAPQVGERSFPIYKLFATKREDRMRNVISAVSDTNTKRATVTYTIALFVPY